MKNLPVIVGAVSLLITAVVHQSPEHGGNPPSWNDPAIQAPCFDPSGEHDEWVGSENIHSASYAALPYPYGFVNNTDSNGLQVTNDCGQQGQYIEAGQIGEICTFYLRQAPITPLDPDAIGYVFWSLGYKDLYWIPWGWTAIDGDLVYDTWVWNGVNDPEAWYISGNFAGWRRFYTNPTDPALVGTSIYKQAGIDPDGPGPEDIQLAGTWRITFTNE